jgi:large subunit ribosomal protein L7Ae
MSSAGKAKKSSGKKPAPAPYSKEATKAPAKEPTGPIWEKKPKNFAIGGDIQPRRELGRYVKWPKYVRIQRQRKVLYQRLKVPPSINQFTNTLDKNLSLNLFKLLHKYRPEDATAKKERLAADASAKDAGDDAEKSKKPLYVKYGINHITKLCEDKKAQLVCIAHDVDPVEVRTPARLLCLPRLPDCSLLGWACRRRLSCLPAGFPVVYQPVSRHLGRSARFPFAARAVAARCLPQDGHPLLHRQVQVAPRCPRAQEDRDRRCAHLRSPRGAHLPARIAALHMGRRSRGTQEAAAEAAAAAAATCG